jgi:hypothetical protein
MSNEFNRAASAKASNGQEQSKPAEAKGRKTRRMSFREATQRTKLDVRLSQEEREKFGYRWVNDDPGRIQELLDRGYEIVDNPTIDDERGAERRVGRHDDGSKMNARLMRIPREYMQEDEAERREMRRTQIDSVVKERGVDPEARREGIRAEQMSITN